MDTLDHKLSTELTEMKNILINLQRQIEANRGYSSDATHQTKVFIIIFHSGPENLKNSRA